MCIFCDFIRGKIPQKNVWNYFTHQFKGSERSKKAKKNILAMFFIKGGNIALNFLLVPLTLHYVNSETYGIWLTISSMVAWLSFFDIGINNGLKNKLAEAFAHKNYILGKKYVSTTYAILALIFIPVMFVGIFIIPHINWYGILNITSNNVQGLYTALSIVLSYFCIQFILSTINIILQADQRPADSALRTMIQNFCSVIIICFLIFTTKGNLVKLCLALCLAPIFVLLLFNFTLFKNRYKSIAPSFSFIDFSTVPSLMKLGIQFFIIQIAAIIQFQMMNFIILRYYGASEVTAYNIAHKYFNTTYMIWGIILTPLWAATTDAIANNDFKWVKNATRKYLRLFFIISLPTLMMLFLAQPIYNIWIGDKVFISNSINIWTMIYFLGLMFGSTFVYILNGASLLKIQTIASFISPLVFLFTCYIFIKAGIGVCGILIAAIIANFNGIILAPIQYYWNFEKTHYKS